MISDQMSNKMNRLFPDNGYQKCSAFFTTVSKSLLANFLITNCILSASWKKKRIVKVN